jgi:hypothetical protein
MLPRAESTTNLANTMNVGLKFDVSPEDDGYLTLRISAWNGSFGGKATVYVDAEQLKETAIQLRGFPVSPSDIRELSFGEFGPKCAGGAAGLRFYCINGRGHARLHATIESDHDRAGNAEFARMTLSIEPAALDRFVEGLDKLDPQKAAQVFMEGK